MPAVEALLAEGLADELVLYEPDLKLSTKSNELRIRNLGLQKSRDAGCTHHISADADEFYVPEQLEYAMRVMEDGGFDSSLVLNETYYKQPTWLIRPNQGFLVSLIHPVGVEYDNKADFHNGIDETRRLTSKAKCRQFSPEEFVVHHMSYVRKNLHRKMLNNSNGFLQFDLTKFLAVYDKYELGGRVMTIPDFRNRKTVEVPNRFNITI